MDSRLQGWQADPFGLHELRYFSAGNPTKLVRDAGVDAYDEPPSHQARPADAALAATVPDDPEPEAAEVVPAMTFRDPVLPWRAPNSGVPAPRRRTGLVYAIVALVAVAAVLIFVVIVGGFSSKGGSHSASSGADLTAFVTRSASQTLAQKTADFTLRGTINLGSSQIDLTGSGQADFAANTLALHVSSSYSGKSLATVNEVATPTDIYQELIFDGQSMAKYLDGRQWFAIPLAASPAQNGPQDSAAGNLQMLAQPSVRVAPMGTQDIGGRSCTEYVVTPSTQAILAAAQREWAKLGLSSSQQAAAQQQLDTMTPPTITVWFDPQRQLTCQLDVYLELSLGPPTSSASSSTASAGGTFGFSSTDWEQVLMTFTRYGVPVTITPPAQSDTLNL